MAQRKVARDHEDWLEEPGAFLRSRGIVPENERFTERQLARELTRRGWRWQIDPGEIVAAKAYPTAETPAVTLASPNPDRIAAFASILEKAIRFDEEHGLSLTGPVRSDIVVRAPDRRIIALVEVKSARDLRDEDVGYIRRSLMSSAREYALAPFFLLVTQDTGYVWDQQHSGVLPFAPATTTFSMAPVIARYLPWLSPSEQPGAPELELATAQWLGDIARSASDQLLPSIDALGESAFWQELQGASIATDARI